MMPTTRRAAAPLLSLALAALAACGGDKSPTPPPQCSVSRVAPPSATIAPLQPGPYHAEFVAAAREFHVPASVLESVGWTETRWTMVSGGAEFEGQAPAYGVMALRGEALERGARLAGVPASAVRTDARSNIRAAAALLAEYGREAGADPASPATWAEASARYSGIEVPEARNEYATRVLSGAGVARPMPLAYVAADPCVTPPPVQPDFAGAIWRASPNFNSRMGGEGGKIHMVIIHTCEGNYSGCWSWLVSTQSGVSAHYVVNDDGSEVTQTVKEADRAWQIAAIYDCTLNFGHDCRLNGTQSNHFTLGIEHAGFADTTPWQAGMIDKSAQLVCDMSKRWDIPRDWRHIVAHGQLQPSNRTDPGPNWPWAVYIGKIQRYCGELVVDDANARNDTTVAKATASSSWFAATETAGFYASGYRWADSGAATDDPLVFSFYLPEAGQKTVEAWWTAGTNRTSAARYVALNAAGDTLGSATADQRSNGGDWQRLGQWTFPAGWNRILLSRQGPSGSVVVGDAVRLK